VTARVSMTLPQYARQECGVDGRPVHLTPHEADLLATLLVSPPDRLADYDLLIEALWPDADQQPLTAINIVHVLLVRLRRKGVTIHTGWGRGLVVPPEARGGPLAPEPRRRDFTPPPRPPRQRDYIWMVG
jgi:hypothetical protein